MTVFGFTRFENSLETVRAIEGGPRGGECIGLDRVTAAGWDCKTED